MNGSTPKQSARDLLAEAHPALVGLSHWIHANPELGYEETLAAGWVAEWLATAGFDVQTGIAGMETALSGTIGPGPFHVVICAEYDALPAVGHACGHNVIAAASVGAAIALAAVAEQLGLRVTLLGTPAEEGGGGKLQLIQAGAFDGVHAALMVHPGPEDVAEPSIIAVQQLEVAYTGREAHASAYPEEGVNAADAMVIAQAAIGLLRQQLQTSDRVHGIVTRGGEAPNIIPAHTTARFMTRAATRERLTELTARVRRCFEAGALATGAELSFEEGVAYAQMKHDPDLRALYVRNAEELGRTFDPNATLVASTDMGDVSHVVPSIHPIIGIHSRPAVNHQPDFAAAAVSEAADQAIFDGALALAWTVIDAAQDVALRERLTSETWAPLVLDVQEAEPATEETLELTSEATPEMADAYVVVDEYVVVPIADEATSDADAAASGEAPGSTEMTDAFSTDSWSAAMSDPWAEPAAEAVNAPVAENDDWANPVVDAAPAAGATYEWTESPKEAVAEPEPAGAEPTETSAWAEPTETAAWVEPTEASAWAEPTQAVSDAEPTEAAAEARSEEAWSEFSSNSGAPETVAEAAEAAPDQGSEHQAAEPVAQAETSTQSAAESNPEMEWVTDPVTEPVTEPVAEATPEYRWFQPTTIEATTYVEATTEAAATEYEWSGPATEAVAEPVEAAAESEPVAEHQWSEPATEAVAESTEYTKNDWMEQATEAIAEPLEAAAESEPVAEPDPVYEWMQPTENERVPVEAVAETESVEPVQEPTPEYQWMNTSDTEAESVEAVAESEPVAEPELVVALAETTESASEYAWMQPIDAVAEPEPVEAVAEPEHVADADPVEAVQSDGTPFDSWAQPSADALEAAALNGHSGEWHDHESVSEPAEHHADASAAPAAEASGDAWAEPVAEATHQPAADTWTQPAADAWGEPVAEIHAEGANANANANGNGNGHGNGFEWHEPAEAETEASPVEGEPDPDHQHARSWSAEHALWETAFADALAELDTRPTPVEAWRSTASSEDAPHWGGAEAQSWDEAARVD